MIGHSGVAGFQVGNLFIRAHETHLWDEINKTRWLGKDPVYYALGPELDRGLKLLKNINCVRDIDRAVRLDVRSVAQFANAGMAGARVVPTVGGFGDNSSAIRKP